MARQTLVENQLFEGKEWNGFTSKNHLINAFDFNPVDVLDKITQIQEVNLGEDFVSMIAKHGTYYIENGKDEYEWRLENAYKSNYTLEAVYEDRAGTVLLGTNNSLPGANRSRFYMDFVNKVFSVTETIVGEKPDLYTLLVVNEPRNVGGDIWRYEVELVNNSADHYIPLEELFIGSRWSCASGLVTDTLSDRGFDVSFNSKTKLNGFLSAFRMQHTVAGNMTKLKPMGFFVTNPKNQKKEMLWLSNVEWAMLTKARYATADMIMNNHSNRWSDGTYGNYDKNGNAIKSGSGFREQWAASNKHVYNVEPDLDFLTEIALDAVVGKVDRTKRKMVIRAGEYGIKELSAMVQRKLGSAAITNLNYLGDNTGRAYSWKSDNFPGGNEMSVKLGQFSHVALINGIEFFFMIDPLKDDPARNKLAHPKGGLASSYEYDIMGFGATDEKTNMQIVRRKDEAPIWGEVAGMRGFAQNGATSFSNPKSMATSIDGSTIHYHELGVGAIVWDPTKIIQYHPSITQ